MTDNWTHEAAIAPGAALGREQASERVRLTPTQAKHSGAARLAIIVGGALLAWAILFGLVELIARH